MSLIVDNNDCSPLPPPFIHCSLIPGKAGKSPAKVLSVLQKLESKVTLYGMQVEGVITTRGITLTIRVTKTSTTDLTMPTVQ
jgi:hypothetical protein